MSEATENKMCAPKELKWTDYKDLALSDLKSETKLILTLALKPEGIEELVEIAQAEFDISKLHD